MSVRKTNGKWRVQVDVGRKADGTRDRRTKTVATRAEARALEAEWLTQKDANDGRLRRCTVRQFVEGYWWPMKEESLEQTSLDSYSQDLRLRIMPMFADFELSEVTRADVQAMVNLCSGESTAKRARDLLRAIYNEAISAGICSHNPAAGRFQMPRKAVHAHDSAEREVWLTTFAQHRPVLEAAKGKGEIEKIVVLGLCFGLRKEEILGLDVGDIDFGKRVLRIGTAYVQTSKGNIAKPTKTAESFRTVPMTKYSTARLAALASGMSPESPFVLSREGKRLSPSTATKMMRRFVTSEGLPYVTIKTMRHSFASACLDAGIDIAKVSKWLGHTNIMTTYNRYVKARRSDLDDAAGSIDAALEKAGLE